MSPELAAISRTIDLAELGQRLKLARIAAGKTQADVAGGEITAAYVSRIEAGARRPEAGLLERMAGRIDTTVDELLLGISIDKVREVELALDHAELAAVSGDDTSALAQASAALDNLGPDAAPELRRRARLIQALAWESAGDLDQSIIALEDLTAVPSADPLWLKALIGLSRCYRELGDFDRAIRAGERAESTIEELGLEGLTETIQLTLTVAAAYMQRGDVDHAKRICMRAVEASERYRSPIAKASAYWNASLIESRKGAHLEAIALARRALALFETGEDSRNLGRLRTQIAAMELKTDPPNVEGARQTIATAVRELEWSSAGPIDLADLHLIRARTEYLQGNVQEAREAIGLSRSLSKGRAPLLNAEALVLEGRIATTTSGTDEARAHFQEAVGVLTSIGADRDAAQLWFELGGLMLEIGDRDAALDAFQRASISTGLVPSQGSLVPTQA